ncbi:MAG: hypothetical protein HYS04_08680 [Acidobacteria bacterium]|nr:hypothetical protein [Acidobacteriota bacterium]
MHRHIADQFIHEGLAALPAFPASGALDAVREFHDGHHGETDLDLAVIGFELFQDLPDGVALRSPAITPLKSRINPTSAGWTTLTLEPRCNNRECRHYSRNSL